MNPGSQQDLARIIHATMIKAQRDKALDYYGSKEDTCVTKKTPKKVVQHIDELCQTIDKGDRVLVCFDKMGRASFMFLL